MRSAVAVSAVAALALLGACQSADVGQRCTLGGNNPVAVTPADALGDYLETGNPACDNFVCIVSPIQQASAPGDIYSRYGQCADGTSLCGYCSKPCVSNEDCFHSKTGLECRQMVLDPAFLATLDDATRQAYLADIQFSSYCAVPLPR
ncbi:MAG TPA: adventurous gliding motility lipoprotein CglC [Anaeromyxobacteraceae bacterium]|nr:adventurous gliding motility lipoprotein CglC [Anaeromyxobacteraceae bacterium]